MNKLSQYLVEQMLLEDENPIKKVVVIYGGRFQPFHKGHYGTYQHLVKKFGKDNVFISTSNKVEKPKSPFNFKEKVKIMTTMFNIPKSKIVQVKNNYAPKEILDKYDKETTAFVTVVGEKDSGRLSGKYFRPWKGTAEIGYEEGGYVYASPQQGSGISGTETRNGLSVGSDEQKQNFFKNRAYGKFNATIFKMITDKLNEGIEIPKEVIEDWLINESSKMSTGQVDDGPNFFFPNYDVFSRINIKRAQKIGYEVVNMITTKEIEDYYEHPNYPNGPVKAVSFFPAGVLGTLSATNQVDIYSSGAYSQWFKHATRKATLVGYELVNSVASTDDVKQDKKISGDLAKGDKKLKDEFENSLNENITLPVKVGDTILTGRFKNKKVVVKSIGKDEHGMPTINGKKVVTFRLMKEGFYSIFEDEKEDEKYTHVGGGNYKLKGKEDGPTFKKDDSGKYTQIDGGEDSSKEEPKQGAALKQGSYADKVKKEKEIQKKLSGDTSTEQEPEQDNWEKVDDKKNYYKSVRKYTDKELEDETGEYFENETTMKTAPNAFKDKADMIEKMKNAKAVYLSSEEMEHMNNTDMGNILNSDNPKQTAKDLADEYGKDISWQYGSMEKNEKVPAPIALRDKNGEYHLLAGNTRAMAFTAAGKKLPIKVIDYDGEFQWQEDEKEDTPPDWLKTVSGKVPSNSDAAKKATQNTLKKIKTGLKKFTHEEKKYFNNLVKNSNEVKTSFVQKLKDKAKGAGKAIKDGLKHEAHLFKSASKTIGQLASGKTKFKDLEPEQKKELKSVGIKILVTGAFAASGGVSATASGIGKLAGMTMAELAPHVVVETILKGIGRAALFADENQEDEARLNKFAELLIEELQKTEITTEMLGNIVEKHNQSKQNSVNEIAGTAVQCEKCNHSWDIEEDDKEKYLCHSCGWDSQKQEYDYGAFDSWQEKMGLNEDIDERSKGKLRPADKLRRKAALAGKRAQIAIRRKRTMMRRKSINKLKKIAYKKAYLEVYQEFMEDLFPGKSKSDLTIQQAKVVHKNVLRKKKRVLKRARFKFLPQLRDAEVDKFDNKSNISFDKPNEKNEMSKSTLNKIEKYAEKQLSPEDIEFTKHFFDRLNDPRNGKEISDAELTGFFKRLSKYKKKFKEFLEKYQQIVVKDKRHDINIPFVKQANQIIAKTVMRKDDFKTSNPVLAFEQLAKGMTLRDIAKKHSVDFEELKKEAQKGVKVEMEHTSDVNQAYDIAKDHLFEDPKYYTKLATIEEVGVGTGQSGIRMGYPSKDDLKKIEKRVQKQRSNTDSNQEYQYEPIRENINESKLLMEGGAYGHMSHPFDTDINLTFGQLKDIVNRALEGTLEYTREKTDGQALAISWRDGRLVAARNKGHLKNKGENALDIKGVSDKFQGRGGLSDAYNFAMKDLSNAIKSLNDKQRDKIFKQGACFMNLEVIYPTSVNVIPYGQALLVFHGTMEYNDEGIAIGENGEAARILAGMIKQVNKDVQDNYTIQGPPVVKLPKSQDLSKKRAKYSSQISKLQKEFGLKDTDGVANYHQAWWEQWVDKNSPSTLDNKTKMGLVKRWAFMDKKFRLDKSNISDDKTLQWAQKIDKEDQSKISKQNLMKFEQIFLGLGAEVLEFTSSALTVNPDAAVRDMKKRIDQTIKDVKKSGDPKKIEKLKLELERLNSIGGAKKIVPNEGIVFLYNGNTFKLTGTFASVNQILGIFF